MKLLNEQHFSGRVNGAAVKLFTLRNRNGCVAQFTNYGARWLSMWVPDRNGDWDDVVLGFEHINDYLNASEKYHGAVVGRTCGRIRGGQFKMNNNIFRLSQNDTLGNPEKNHLHGGFNGFSFQVWEGSLYKNKDSEETLVLHYLSKDGEEGYPGNLKVTVTYTLSNSNEIRIAYAATCDRTTPINLTNHTYFNLSGHREEHVMNHLLFVNAESVLTCDDTFTPTGGFRQVINTALDFTRLATIGSGTGEDLPGVLFTGKGYNAAYVLNHQDSVAIARAVVISTVSGRKLELYTDQPVLQLYNAWFFDGTDTGKHHRKYTAGAGLALEAQGYTDAPNHAAFPPIFLHPGQEYQQQTIYKFLVQTE